MHFKDIQNEWRGRELRCRSDLFRKHHVQSNGRKNKTTIRANGPKKIVIKKRVLPKVRSKNNENDNGRYNNNQNNK